MLVAKIRTKKQTSKQSKHNLTMLSIIQSEAAPLVRAHAPCSSAYANTSTRSNGCARRADIRSRSCRHHDRCRTSFPSCRIPRHRHYFFDTQKVKTSAPSASILQLSDCKTITIRSRWEQMEQMAANFP